MLLFHSLFCLSCTASCCPSRRGLLCLVAAVFKMWDLAIVLPQKLLWNGVGAHTAHLWQICIQFFAGLLSSISCSISIHWIYSSCIFQLPPYCEALSRFYVLSWVCVNLLGHLSDHSLVSQLSAHDSVPMSRAALLARAS